MADRRRQDETGVKDRTAPKIDKPQMWKVIFHNDDYTAMEFVVWVLTDLFKHSPASATRVMLHIHKTGIGVAGTYTKEVAETRIEKTMELAREFGYPLQLTMEPE
jgi:ATP-dependent Clp protease adaptor protein ClpS